MNPKLPYIISLVAYLCGANLVLAASEEAQPNCDQTTNLNLKTNDIFDLTDPDTIFLHHWANLLHIKTKDITLINESAFFIQKCDIAQADIDELERHLRKKAKIYP
ncbi:MAG: hypothetical protein ABNH03_16145 [Alteromonas sp.]|jgi:hypothetical protein|uniref:hypothetical protein n=1 Tax=Alteromonas sp. TaxID=232 RepID=UPI0032D98813